MVGANSYNLLVTCCSPNISDYWGSQNHECLNGFIKKN